MQRKSCMHKLAHINIDVTVDLNMHGSMYSDVSNPVYISSLTVAVTSDHNTPTVY